MEFRRVLFRSTAIGNTHHCRPGTCSRDLLALAQGDALQRLYPSQPQGLPRPFERSGHWVPGTSPGTTALDLARASPSGTRCVNVVGSTPRVTVKVGALDRKSTRLNSSH